MYENYFIKNKKFYNTLVWKLRHILSDNPNLEGFKYNAVKYFSEKYPQRKEVGILVDGKDRFGMEFFRFYSVDDIDFYHYQLNKRLEIGGR